MVHSENQQPFTAERSDWLKRIALHDRMLSHGIWLLLLCWSSVAEDDEASLRAVSAVQLQMNCIFGLSQTLFC